VALVQLLLLLKRLLLLVHYDLLINRLGDLGEGYLAGNVLLGVGEGVLLLLLYYQSSFLLMLLLSLLELLDPFPSHYNVVFLELGQVRLLFLQLLLRVLYYSYLLVLDGDRGLRVDFLSLVRVVETVWIVAS
jgi:hypothetical protein